MLCRTWILVFGFGGGRSSRTFAERAMYASRELSYALSSMASPSLHVTIRPCWRCMSAIATYSSRMRAGTMTS